MSNWFNLILDTTPPTVTIHTPQYVLNGHYFEFRVSVNEKADPGRFEAKAKDNAGNEYLIILDYIEEENEFVGLVDTYGFNNGLAKVVLTIYDEVHNSTTIEKTFKILNNEVHSIKLKMIPYLNKVSYKVNKNKITSYIRKNVFNPKLMKNKIVSRKRRNTINFKVGE